MDWLAKVSEIDSRNLRVEFDVQPTLWGRPGIPTTIAALMVLPRGSKGGTPGDLRSDAAEDFSSSSRRPVP